MKSLTEYLTFEVKGRRGFVNITPTIEDQVLKCGVNEGLCLVNAMHITRLFILLGPKTSYIRRLVIARFTNRRAAGCKKSVWNAIPTTSGGGGGFNLRN
jgi:hypothetical protein